MGLAFFFSWKKNNKKKKTIGLPFGNVIVDSTHYTAYMGPLVFNSLLLFPTLQLWLYIAPTVSTMADIFVF